jgi:hypothetical protein
MPEPTQSGKSSIRTNNIIDVEHGPTGADCKGFKTPGGEYGFDPDSCLGAIGLIQSGQNAGFLACAGGIKFPEEGHTLAPWVALTFEGSDSTITVGNDSSPNTDPLNVACISSFEFGYSDGLTMRCTIHDQEGGSFVTFMDHLVKDWICMRNGTPAEMRIKIQFGWAHGTCGQPLPTASSRCYYCLSDAVETNYREGKFIFEITGKDLCHRMFEGSVHYADGGEGQNAIPIVDAITEFMTAGCPPNVASVRFLRMEGGKGRPCPFKYGGNITSEDEQGAQGPQGDRLKGPRGKWLANGQDKLNIAIRWLTGHPTDRDKGWMPQYNSEAPGGELIFWEDPMPTNPQDSQYWDQNCLGVYIVNGGKRSPVIEFSPKIHWDFSRLTSGGGQLDSTSANATGQPGSTQPGYDIPGLDAETQRCAGHNTQATSTETHRDNFGAQQTREVIQAQNASHRALKIMPNPIEADLLIVGDPTLLPPSEAMMSKNITVIVIDPYFIRRPVGNNNNQLEWLAKPLCNPVLSNKAWICKSISHRIELGKFTTTIGMVLTDPGTATPPDTQIGGWLGGWTPTPQCE